MPNVSHLLRTVSLSVTGAVLFAAAPAMAADWGPTTTIAPAAAERPDAISGLEFAGDAAGNLTAVWIGANDGTRGVYAASRPASGPWGPAAKIVDAPGAEKIQLSVGADGHAIVGWNNRTGHSSYVYGVATRTPAGVWTVTEGPSADAFAELAIDDSGNATVLATDTDGNLVSKTRTAGGTWGAPQVVALADIDPGDQVIENGIDHTDLAVAPGGDAVASWVRAIDDKSVVQIARKPKGGTWTAPQTVASGTTTQSGSRPGTILSQSTVGVDGAGQATVAWSELHDAQPIWTTRVRSTVGAPNGSWAPITNVSGDLTVDSSTWPSGGVVPEAREPDITVGAGGESVITWDRLDGDVPAIFSSLRAAGGSWQPASRLADRTPWSPAPATVVDRAGNATVAWADGAQVLSKRVALRTAPVPPAARGVSFSARLSSWNRACPLVVTAYANGRSAQVPVRPTNSRTTCSVSGLVPAATGTRLGSQAIVFVSGGGLFPTITVGKVVAR